MVIPTCNEGDLVAMTVESVLASAGELPFEVVVVDDGSTDGCCDPFRSGSHPVRLVEAGGLGVARARNHGAAFAGGEMLVFLDAHCTVDVGWLDRLAAGMRRPDVALVSPVFTPLGEEEPRGAGMGWQDALLDAFWYEPVPGAQRPYDVPLACGACQAFPAETFAALGRFDEGCTRWGFEDHEIALRCWALGYRVVVHPQVTVAHLFRTERSNYDVDDDAVLYNFLRMATLHLSDTRVERLVEQVRGHPGLPDALQRIDDSDTREVRDGLRAARVRDEEWFFAAFFPHLVSPAA